MDAPSSSIAPAPAAPSPSPAVDPFDAVQRPQPVFQRPLPPPPAPITTPFTAFYRPTHVVAKLMVDKDLKYSKASPRAKELAVRRKSREIGRARTLSLKELPNLKIAYDPYYRPYLRAARQRLHAYYTEFMAPTLALPKFTREDFPSAKPPPEKIGGHLYSQRSYEKFLRFITTITIPLPTATDEKIKEAGFRSWKEYVIHAVLENWHPRIDAMKFRLRITYLPGCVPQPPQCVPRRSARLARKSMSSDELRWSDDDI